MFPTTKNTLLLRRRRAAAAAPAGIAAPHAHAAPAAALHWVTAGFFAGAGFQALVSRNPGRGPVRWGALLAAQLAGTAHVARALRSTPRTCRAARVLDGVAIAVGGVTLAASVAHGLRRRQLLAGWLRGGSRVFRRPPPSAPLTLGATGILGLLLDQEEEREEEARRRLEGRGRWAGRIADRIVPRRRRRVERIVVHI
jgi:hypothetical protein